LIEKYKQKGLPGISLEITLIKTPSAN
jgi:hypothetical protein